MASENETIADIVAEISTMGEYRVIANRLDAAWKREREALMPKPDPNWKAICEKCHDGDIEPDCEYYGEPMGCNSPIYGEHPKAKPVGNAAAMLEALEYVLHFDATDETAMEDGLTDTERIAEYADHIEEFQKKAKAALSAPPRNCDIYPTNEDSWRSYQMSHADGKVVPDYIDWLFAPAEKGADA